MAGMGGGGDAVTGSSGPPHHPARASQVDAGCHAAPAASHSHEGFTQMFSVLYSRVQCLLRWIESFSFSALSVGYDVRVLAPPQALPPPLTPFFLLVVATCSFSGLHPSLKIIPPTSSNRRRNQHPPPPSLRPQRLFPAPCSRLRRHKTAATLRIWGCNWQ